MTEVRIVIAASTKIVVAEALLRALWQEQQPSKK